MLHVMNLHFDQHIRPIAVNSIGQFSRKMKNITKFVTSYFNENILEKWNFHICFLLFQHFRELKEWLDFRTRNSFCRIFVRQNSFFWFAYIWLCRWGFFKWKAAIPNTFHHGLSIDYLHPTCVVLKIGFFFTFILFSQDYKMSLWF